MKKPFFLLILLILFRQLSFSQADPIDSLLTLLEKDKEDTTKVNHLNSLTFEYKEVGSYDTSLIYGNAALQLARKLNYKKGIGDAYGFMGTSYYYQADYPKALDYYLKALKIDEALNNKEGIAMRLGNLGNVYASEGDNPKSLEYYSKALKLEEELGNKKNIAAWLGNIGIIYGIQNEYQKAVDNYLKAQKIYEELGNKNGISRVFANIGVIYDKQKNYPKALEFYLKALKIAEEVGDKISTLRNLANIGSLYTLMGNFKEAEQYMKKATVIAHSIGALNDLRQVEEWLSQLYDTTGRYKLALIHFKNATALKDTIFNQENKKQLVEKEMNFAFEKKEAAAKAEQDKKDAVAQTDLKRQKLVSYSVIGGLLMMVIVVFIVFRSLRITRKQKSIIQEQKKIVDEKNEHITDSITYALTIQESILPKQDAFKKLFNDAFVLFLPKDIVSGDFYWVKKLGEELLIAVVDCTGHGVPGAFMSLHAYNHLERIVTEKGISSPSLILDELNRSITNTMGGEDDHGSVKNGMDISLIKLNRKTNELEFSGAHNSALILRAGSVIELKADAMPIGNLSDIKFSQKKEKLLPGDMIYLFTDGYKDQKGGPANKRFFIVPFKDLLKEVSQISCEEQQNKLTAQFHSWKGTEEQIDDICVMGIRV
jgi:serine phosphatase RsbU (regulator of sigma subunit)/Tfp pilus assembly protein PilF